MSDDISLDDRKQKQLMEALGILPPDADEAKVFLTWGALISDMKILFSEAAVDATVLAMSIDERRELSTRVKNQLKDVYGWVF
jgi:hypothetical protein